MLSHALGSIFTELAVPCVYVHKYVCMYMCMSVCMSVCSGIVMPRLCVDVACEGEGAGPAHVFH